jgi:hypothetical protein
MYCELLKEIMVDTGTWNRLSADEQNEYQQFSSRFVQAVLSSGLRDGGEFHSRFSVKEDNGGFILTDGNEIFANIRCRNRKTIEALLTEAVQNFGR